MRRFHAVLLAIIIGVCSACSQPDTGRAPTERQLDIASLVPISVPDEVHDVRDVAIHPSGALWVLSSFEPHVMLVGRAGDVIARFGRSGPGPGEFANPLRFVGRRMDSTGVVVWDAGQRRVQRFHEDGEVAGGLTVRVDPGMIVAGIDEKTYVDPGRVQPFGNGFVRDVYAGPVSRAADLWSGALVRVDRRGEVADTLFRFTDLLDGAPPRTPPDMMVPVPLWTACGGRIAVFDSPGEEIVWIDREGLVSDTQSADIPHIPTTEADRLRFIRHQVALEARHQGLDPDSRQFDRLVQQILESDDVSFAEAAPPVNMLCGVEGELWVQLFSTAQDPRGYGRTWIRLDRDGQEVVEMPPRFAPLLIEADEVVGVLTDELGVERVAISMIDRQG